MYWDEHRSLPGSPSDLPDQPNRNCEMTDGWGRELHWVFDGEDRLEIYSLGRDGIPGGNDLDSDMLIVFDGKGNPQELCPDVVVGDVEVGTVEVDTTH